MAVKQAGLASPAIIVVGDVVRLAKANNQEIETIFAKHLAA
jgi:siroheme synthase